MAKPQGLEEKEKSSDQGWSDSCRFPTSDSVVEVDSQTSDSVQQTIVEPIETVVINSSLEESVEIDSQEGGLGLDSSAQESGSQVVDSQTSEKGTESDKFEVAKFQQKPQSQEEGEVQIVENGSEAVQNNAAVQEQQKLKLQPSFNAKGQIELTLTGTCNKPEEKALLEKLLSKVNYQQLANQVNLSSAHPGAARQTVQVNLATSAQPSATQQTVQATRSPQVPLARTTIGPSTPLAQFNSQLGTSSSQTRSPLNINAILNCANQGKISKEDLLKLIKSCRTATGLNTQPQSPQQLQGQKIIQVQSVPTAAGNQVINPVLLAAPVQKIGTVSLAKQTTLANLIQSKSNQGVGLGGVTTSSNVGSPQLSTDNTPPKVVHIAASTPVKQTTTVNNNQVNSNLTLTSPQKVQTVGSLQTVTSKNQTVIIPSGATQYIIVNPGTPIQKVNHQAVGNQQASTIVNSPSVNSGVKLAGAQLTTPVRIIHSASPQLSQVRTPLASPSFSASQSPTKIVIPQNFSVLTSVVDNANIPSTQGVAISVPPGTNVNSQTVGRGIANRRGPQVRQPRPQGRGKRTIKQNYFVNPASAQEGSATSPVQIRPQNCNDAIKAVPVSQPVIIARTQSSGQLVQSNIIKQQVNHTGISMNKLEGASPGQSNSSSLVNYSDSDSPSNSSDKGESESSSELSKSQTSGVRTLSNGALVMPDILSEAIARAKPTDKILVNFTNSKGAVKFQKNTVYKIPCKGENKFYRYDGQYLVPANETTFGLIGGGVGNRKEKPLRGNATGLHMTTPQQGSSSTRSFLNAAEAVGKVFKEGRFWKHTAGPQRTIFRLANNTDQDTDEETSELTSQDNKQGKKRPIEDVSDLPPINDDEMRVVHCKFCGYTSMTVKSCERCCRTFPADTKIEIQKKKLKTDVENKEEDTAISKQTFYGKTVTNQVVLHPATNRDGNIVYVNYVTKGRRVNLEGKTYRSPSVIRGAKQPKKIHTLEPVTISISSDEEEEPEKSGVPESPATGSEPQATVEKDDIGQLLDNIPQSKRTASPVFQNSRMKRMENEEGIPIIRKTGKRKSPTMPPSQGTATNVPPNELADPQRSEEAMDVSIVDFHARVIHIGSVLGCPVEPVFIAEDSISFQVECEDNTHKFIIKPDELQQCMYCLENRPVIFLKTTPEFARKVREMLKLETVNGENGFDPNDHVMKHQFITILLVSLGSLTSQKLECVLRKYPQQKDTTFNFIQQMTANEAALYLKEIQGDESMSEPSTPQPQPHERSPSPPKILFTGPVVKLITFPPPPAPGGIQVTNEDLSCLQEGEFLNDVIIDFYLKYLFLNVLSDKDRERTHMFSSFFFKRLTQRQGRCGPEDSMADKTPAEKKHARVKNWTKKVDLFEKDFIFVPINEHSHWFLAVICFPGLPSAKRITYVPKSASTETQPVTGPEVSPQDLKSKEEEGVGKEPVKSETGLEKEPVKSLKGYRIPKVVKNGEPSSESGDGSVKCLPAEENSRESGKSALESMETDENSLSESQKKEIAEDSEEMMDTSESPTQSEIEQSQTDTEKSKDQSDSSSQDTGKSESESKTETNNQVKAKASKPVFKATVRDLRGRELTEEELKDPSSLKTFTTGCRQPCILIFDSLAGQSRSRIVAILKEYLQVEWDTKKKTPNSLRERIRGCTATKVPQQTNFSDCGVYILQYVESFFEDPIQDFSIPLKSLSDWFTEERVTAKRSEIRELVMSLKDSQEKGKS